MNEDHHIENSDLSLYTMERLQKELSGIQTALDLLFIKNNNLEDLDITEGGGSPEDQAEYQKLYKSEVAIVSEINKRHVLDQANHSA
jgi:hypothetical protein